MNITRRLFLRNTAAAGVVGTAIASPAVAEAKIELSARDRAVAAWAQLIEAISELSPANCRLQIVGDQRFFRVNALRTEMERVHPRVTMPVERFVASIEWSDTNGWYGPRSRDGSPISSSEITGCVGTSAAKGGAS